MAVLSLIGKPCPGFKTYKLGAQASAIVALICGLGVILSAFLAMYFSVRDNLAKVDRRTNAEEEMLQCYYGAGLAIWGTWVMFTCVMYFGIVVENKRALGFWLILTAVLPVYYISGIIFLLVEKLIRGWETQYLVVQGATILILVWLSLAIYVYFEEIRQRDKNPELRVDEFIRRKENEVMFAQPFMGVMPPDGTYNPGYGAPGGGSMSSIPRSQKSRHTYAPTEPTESLRGASIGRQSRFDQYKAQHQPEKMPMKSDRSPEREGGTTYYRYQYNGDGKANPSHHGSQGSLGSVGRRPQHDPYQPPQYQPARFQRPAQPPAQPSPLYGSQPAQPYQPSHHASQGSLGGRQAYQPSHHASQGSIGGRQPYQPSHHASQGSLGGRQAQRFQPVDSSHGKDSEV